MSKIQTSIQKAIEKSRRGSKENADETRSRRSDDISKRSGGAVASDIFRMFRSMRPDREMMKKSRIVSAIDNPSVSAAYNLLRTRVLQRMRSNKWHTLLVTSAGPGEGKTLTASNLAVSLARDVNQSVLLVDLDLNRSTVSRYMGFDIDVQAGIGDFLMGNAEIPEIVYAPSDMDRFGIIPNREPVQNASDLIGSPKMKEFLGWLRQQSDQTIVIFDMPPVLVCDDVLAICPDIDSVLMVVAEGQTDRAGLEKSMELLRDTNLLGVVLNKSTGDGGIDAYGY